MISSLFFGKLGCWNKLGSFSLEIFLVNLSKKSDKKTVLVGITSSLDSIAALYLLKKQGFECIGIALQLVEEENINDEGVFTSCHPKDLMALKAICEKLEVPFYAVNAIDRYKAEISDFFVSAKLSGEKFASCVHCNYLKIDLLLEKANHLKLDFIATGHYAKIHKNEKTGEFTIFVANDLRKDQSFLLSSLKHQHLERLILPLDEIKEEEVYKICGTLDFITPKKKEDKALCFFKQPATTDFVKNNSPPSMRKDGNINTAFDDTYMSEHRGLFRYYVGQGKLAHVSPVLTDEWAIARIEMTRNTVVVDYVKNLRYSRITLNRFECFEYMDRTLPLDVYIQFDTGLEKEKCVLYFKNNDIVVLEFEKSKPGVVVKGQHIAVYSRAAAGGRLIGSGTVIESGRLKRMDRLGLIDPERTIEKDEEKAKKIEFNF